MPIAKQLMLDEKSVQRCRKFDKCGFLGWFRAGTVFYCSKCLPPKYFAQAMMLVHNFEFKYDVDRRQLTEVITGFLAGRYRVWIQSRLRGLPSQAGTGV